MRDDLKRYLTTFTVTSFLVFLATFALSRYLPAIDYDPDRFYHFAISKIYAETGFPQTLPQAEDVGWGQAFAEKEFLFHVLTGLAWGAGAENGVIVFYRLLFALLMTTLGAVIARASRSAWMMPVATAVLIFGCAQFASRMNMLRPHVLAILLLTWQIMAWRAGRWKVAAILGGVYVLAYHAFYIPLSVSAIFILCAYLGGRNMSRQVAWTLLLVAAGIIINPAFPQNIATGVQVLGIATQQAQSIPSYFFGQELHLLNSAQLLAQHGYMLFLPLALTLLFLWRQDLQFSEVIKKRNLPEPALVATLFISILFSLLIFLTPRAFEIALPAGVIAVAAMASRKPFTGRRFILIFLVTFTAFHLKNSLVRIDAASKGNKTVAPASESMRSALSVIPADGSIKVFNWSWWISPFILYHRPDLRFIDLLDPTFLQRTNPEMSRLRLAIFEDRESDPWFVVRHVFHADYVIIPTSMTGTWAMDPHFSAIETPDPVDSQYGFSVFKVAKDRIGRFVTRGRVGVDAINLPYARVLNGLVQPDQVSLDQDYPKIDPGSASVPVMPEMVFVDTFSTYGAKANPSRKRNLKDLDSLKQSLCTRVVVDPGEIRRISLEAGRIDYLGVGGGSWFGVWINGTPVYQTVNPYAPKLVDSLIDLQSIKIKTIKSIEALACTSLTTNRAGLAISLWSKEDLKERCRASLDSPSTSAWLLPGDDQKECFGSRIQRHQASINHDGGR